MRAKRISPPKNVTGETVRHVSPPKNVHMYRSLDSPQANRHGNLGSEIQKRLFFYAEIWNHVSPHQNKNDFETHKVTFFGYVIYFGQHVSVLEMDPKWTQNGPTLT